ncbi:hypothetical protein ACLB2K_011421 [Fragaria x ananassa]
MGHRGFSSFCDLSCSKRDNKKSIQSPSLQTSVNQCQAERRRLWPLEGFKSEEPKTAGVASSTHVVIGGEGCRICGDGHHHTVDCPFLEYVPPGSTVGVGWLFGHLQPTAKWCWSCGEWEERAVKEYR